MLSVILPKVLVTFKSLKSVFLVDQKKSSKIHFYVYKRRKMSLQELQFKLNELDFKFTTATLRTMYKLQKQSGNVYFFLMSFT